jgi:hypothetical protein
MIGICGGMLNPAGGAGVIAAEVGELAPVPTAFVALTLKVYAVPSVRPVMSWLVAVLPNTRGVCAVAPMNGVTVYPVIGLPPLAGADQAK